MVSWLTSSVVDRELESLLGQTIEYMVGSCCFSGKYISRSMSKY